MKTIATLAVSILLAAAASASTPEAKVAPAAKQRPAAVEAAKTAATPAEYDYRLEHEGCCGSMK